MRTNLQRFRLKLLLLLAALITTALLPLQAQTNTVKGTVTDADNGEPLIGATVTLPSGKAAAVTDIDGNFSFTPPPPVGSRRLPSAILATPQRQSL